MAMSDALEGRLAAAAAAEAAGRIGEAAGLLAGLEAAIRDRPAALHLAGVVAARQGDFARAAPLMDRAAKLGAKGGLEKPALALVHRNRIETHRRLLNPRAAIAAGREALALAPDDPVALNNLALAHYDALEIDAALACYDRAIALAPEDPAPRFGRGEVLLACGDLARGWEGYGWRFRLPGVPPPLPPEVAARKHVRRWQGKAMDGTLLVVADQGFGDVVQFARYLPWAAARCTRLVVAASPEMQPVVAQLPGVAERITAWDRLGAFRAWATLSDLPALAGPQAGAQPPYLASAHEDRMRWAARLEELLPRGMRRVGLVWAGRPDHPFDFARSARLAALAPLGDVAGVAWVALQVGPAAAELGGTVWRAPLVNLGPEIAGYPDTMAVLDALDLVVTVDTSVAHVAGAMGKPCWLMLARRPDWRWGLAGAETGWYPAHRLFRQKRLGDWAGLAREVAQALG
jgi:tetratricopeptide (TPR) repeat protein